ncbi:MAG: putative toxin-antitoxin system toxin component, PIN family [Prevotella sp.]|nr:putative toxin-antitoxin system toxin component, PIN family [Prevotella sp.]
MRLYLDTNILIYMLTGQSDYIDKDTYAMISDTSIVMYTSTVCVQEIIHLRQIGKIFARKKRDKTSQVPIIDMLNDLGVEIVPVNETHLKKLDELPMLEEHRDPNDRIIIAQAIADRATLVSSDLKFPEYIIYGLQLHQNKK